MKKIIVICMLIILITNFSITIAQKESLITINSIKNSTCKVMLQPRLSYHPKSHDFGDMRENKNNITTFEIWNNGCCGLTYTLVEHISWVDVNPTFGFSYGEHDTITVSVNIDDLSLGHHNCNISIFPNDPFIESANFTVTLNKISNTPPTSPDINGPTTCRVKEEKTYTIQSTDTNGDDLYYYIDWDDKTDPIWLGPYSSGDLITIKHTWDTIGNYKIRAKAKDSFNAAESDWSTLEVTTSKIKPYLNLFSLYFYNINSDLRYYYDFL
jgi:hypothetical protein